MKYHSLADEENESIMVITLNQRKKIRLYNKHRQVGNTRSGLFENNVWGLHYLRLGKIYVDDDYVTLVV